MSRLALGVLDGGLFAGTRLVELADAVAASSSSDQPETGTEP